MVTFLHPSVAESMVKIFMEANSLITDLQKEDWNMVCQFESLAPLRQNS